MRFIHVAVVRSDGFGPDNTSGVVPTNCREQLLFWSFLSVTEDVDGAMHYWADSQLGLPSTTIILPGKPTSVAVILSYRYLG